MYTLRGHSWQRFYEVIFVVLHKCWVIVAIILRILVGVEPLGWVWSLVLLALQKNVPDYKIWGKTSHLKAIGSDWRITLKNSHLLRSHSKDHDLLEELKKSQKQPFFFQIDLKHLKIKNNCTKSLTKLKPNFKTKEIRKDMSRRLKKLWSQIKVTGGNV